MPICKRKGAGVLRPGLAALLALALPLWATNTSKGPDGGGYTATDSAVYSFVDLASAGGAANVLSGVDDGVTLLTLPFAFQFYGNAYNLVCVSANGLISFVTSAAACTPTADFVNTDLSSTATPGDFPSLAPYWTDLTFQVSGAGAVYYQTQGTPGSRQFIIEWSNAFLQQSPNEVTFEAILSEGTNQVLFQYQSVDFGQGVVGNDGSLATVGIRNSGGQTNGREIAWSYNAAVLANGSAILFSSAPTKIAPTLTWAPPADILFGSALGSAQLNATANVPGVFVYTPPAGTVLPVGSGQTLSATFTPSDTTHYTTASASTKINVKPGTATGVQIIVTRVLSRDANNNIVALLTLANAGAAAATNVTLTSAKIGTTAGSPIPQTVGTIPAQSIAQATVTIPGTVGNSGTASTFTVTGTYTGGSFTSNARITLP